MHLRFYGFAFGDDKNIKRVPQFRFFFAPREINQFKVHQDPYYYVIWYERIARMLTHSAFTHTDTQSCQEMPKWVCRNKTIYRQLLCVFIQA